MNVRLYNSSDYSTLVGWYSKWNLPVTPESWIPSTSIVVENQNNNLICVGFLYQMGNTPMAYAEGIMTNPEANKEDRKDALNLLITEFVKLGRELKCEIVITSTPRIGLENTFKELGFGSAPEKYSHLARFI